MTPDLTAEFHQALGNELRLLRRNAGLTLSDASAKIRHGTGIRANVSNLCRWERGHRLSLDQLIAICDVYGAYAPFLIHTALRHATRCDVCR